MKTWKMLFPLLAVLAFSAAPLVPAQTPAGKLGWTLAVHSYTFKDFSIFEAIDKTAALGVKHMSVSGNVNLTGPDGKPVRIPIVNLTDKDFADITARLKAKGLSPTFVNT